MSIGASTSALATGVETPAIWLRANDAADRLLKSYLNDVDSRRGLEIEEGTPMSADGLPRAHAACRLALALVLALGGFGASLPAAADGGRRDSPDFERGKGLTWIPTWATASKVQSPFDPPTPAFNDVTLRQVVRISVGGRALRVWLTNESVSPSGSYFLPTYTSAEAQAIRRAVNDWIRTSNSYDRVADFDAALRDPHDNDVLNPAYTTTT